MGWKTHDNAGTITQGHLLILNSHHLVKVFENLLAVDFVLGMELAKAVRLAKLLNA